MSPIRRADRPLPNRSLTFPPKIAPFPLGLKLGCSRPTVKLAETVVWGDGVHPVLRSAFEAKARLAIGLRIALAMLGLFARELHATLARLVAYGAALAALALILVEIASSRGGSAKTANPEWIEVIKPLPAFALTMPEFEAQPRYSIWRHVS